CHTPAYPLRPTTEVHLSSSRRRHTRSYRDWSSDVCSSDLRPHASEAEAEDQQAGMLHAGIGQQAFDVGLPDDESGRDGEPAEPEIGRASCRERTWGWAGVEASERRVHDVELTTT